jgi:hypothetical protein
MIKVNVRIPKGYKATGEFRRVTFGELYYDSNATSSVETWEEGDSSVGKYIILRKVVKQKEQLVGCLCGVANCFLAIAKDNADNFTKLRVINYYDAETEMYVDVTGGKWAYAYPVSEDKLKELTHYLKK